MNLVEQLHKLPANQKKKKALVALRECYKSDLYWTSKYLLGYKDINVRTHGDMISALEAPTKRKLIVMPRGTFKSSIASIAYPIWLLINNPDLRIMLDSELYTNSKNLLREAKAHLMSVRLTELFGEFKTDSCWAEGEVIIRQRTKVLKDASIVCSGMGAEKTGTHFDIIIADDMNSPSNSMTIEGRRKVIDHYRMYTSILEPHGTLVVVGTRYAEDDVIGHVLRNEVFIDQEEESSGKGLI